MANKVPPALADLFNKILVNFNQSQSKPQMERNAVMSGNLGVGVLGKRGRDDINSYIDDAFGPAPIMSDGPSKRARRAPFSRSSLPKLSFAGLTNWDSPGGFFNNNRGGSRRGAMKAVRNGSWHPLARVKNAIADMLPSRYSSRYRMTYNFGPGRPSGTTTATKVKWRKLLGDVFAVNGMHGLSYTKGKRKAYSSPKAQRRALSRRAGLKSARYYRKNGY